MSNSEESYWQWLGAQVYKYNPLAIEPEKAKEEVQEVADIAGHSNLDDKINLSHADYIVQKN